MFGIGALLAYSYLAGDIGFTPTDNSWEVENVDEALNDLFDKMNCDISDVGTVWNYAQFDVENVFYAPCYGNYKLELWGGQGGQVNTSVYGGFGGYAVGNIYLRPKEKLYVYVGGQGQTGYGTNFTKPGGFNGGGTSSVTYNQSLYAGSGGGASHIATAPGLLSTLSDNQSSIIIVAGGGGGAGYYSSSNYGAGGCGGGFKGRNGSSYLKTNVGTGGTQTEPGYTSGYPAQGNGAFGQGASTSGSIYAAGGGGFYGGGLPASNANGAGGGSGYIASARLNNKVMFCYGCEESSETSTKTINTAGSSSERNTAECSSGYALEPISKCAKEGNGHIRITYLGQD